jgi:hypothetical protein
MITVLIMIGITGVSEVRVLILTSGRARQIMELFSNIFTKKQYKLI